MAGTAHAGLIETHLERTVWIDFPGANPSIGTPFRQWTFGQTHGGGPRPVDWKQNFFTGAVTAAGGGGAAVPNVAWPGIVDDTQSGGQDWYEQVHILPRSAINFGSLLTQTDVTFEIYNAFRSTSVVVSAIINGATPGVELPDTVPPVTLPPGTSHFRSSTTSNNGGTALGVIAFTRVRALTDGVPSFDAIITFDVTAPGNDVALRVIGDRVVALPFDYDGTTIVELLEALTEVDEAIGGKEQRRSIRKRLRQSFEVAYQLDGVDRQHFHALFFDWLGNSFGFPLRHEAVRLTAAVSVGATTYPVSGADAVDFRVGGLALVVTDRLTFDVVKITAATDTLITGSSASVYGYPAGTPIMPMRSAKVLSAPSERDVTKLETFRVRFACDDNDTGVADPISTPGFWSTFNSRVLLDDCNVVNNRSSGGLTRRVHVVDGKTGLVSVTSDWDRGKRSMTKGFSLRSRQQIKDMRRLFGFLRGRTKAFYMPSKIEDLTPVANLVAADDKLDVSRIDYVRFVRNRFPFTTFEIHFADGTSLVRTVTASVVVSATVERLTLSATWPSNRTVAEIERIEFYDLMRFDSDVLRIAYARTALASAELPVVRVFDDN